MPKRTLLVILALALFLGFLLILRVRLNQTPTPSPTPTPAKTTTITETLQGQQPFLVKPTGTSTEYYVGQTEGSQYQVVVGDGNQLKYSINKNVKSFAYPKLDGYISQYGQPNETRYGPWFEESNFYSYVFLSSGLIVVAHPNTGTVIEVWQIQPNLTANDFNAQYSNLFYITPPPRNTQM